MSGWLVHWNAVTSSLAGKGDRLDVEAGFFADLDLAAAIPTRYALLVLLGARHHRGRGECARNVPDPATHCISVQVRAMGGGRAGL